MLITHKNQTKTYTNTKRKTQIKKKQPNVVAIDSSHMSLHEKAPREAEDTTSSKTTPRYDCNMS